MARGYSFTCQNCGYEAMVSGQKDSGWVAVVETMICKQCRQLVDVSVGGHVGRFHLPQMCWKYEERAIHGAMRLAWRKAKKVRKMVDKYDIMLDPEKYERARELDHRSLL